jgi:hypothetical protein
MIQKDSGIGMGQVAPAQRNKDAGDVVVPWKRVRHG